MREKLVWFISGAIAFFVVFLMLGGLYTITPPNGPVDAAYKINRLTGRVWLVKTYSKQVGQIRVLAAREAAVEKTKEFTEADFPAVAAQEPLRTSGGGRRR
ncbi:MAG: hypothetical protein HYU47_04330 [Deltaproteobacteria bacterium]|nr:hypothetical protein [Deltaproteobacteria bacterium]